MSSHLTDLWVAVHLSRRHIASMTQDRKTHFIGWCTLALGIFVGVLSLTSPSHAAPEAELWPHWQAHDPQSTKVVDHTPWNALLGQYRRAGSIARFDYAAARKEEAGDRLDEYLAALGKLDPRKLNRSEQMAFWVNLYNALTVSVVLQHGPVDSIRDIDISPGLFSSGPWGRKLMKVAGVEVSLDDIEHRILRPIWQDARLHYVLNCASLGCPDLPEQAVTAANAEGVLDQAARTFINHPRGARLDGKGRLHVSSIYSWFQEDFGGNDRGVIRHLKQYAGPELAGGLSTVTEIEDHDYDWRLNRP